jgi:hypothetical protein
LPVRQQLRDREERARASSGDADDTLVESGRGAAAQAMLSCDRPSEMSQERQRDSGGSSHAEKSIAAEKEGRETAAERRQSDELRGEGGAGKRGKGGADNRRNLPSPLRQERGGEGGAGKRGEGGADNRRALPHEVLTCVTGAKVLAYWYKSTNTDT